MSTQNAFSTITLRSLQKFKENEEKFACLTAYDACFSSILSKAGVEVILVGDSLGMVLQGHDSTCLLYTSPSPRDRTRSRMPSSA